MRIKVFVLTDPEGRRFEHSVSARRNAVVDYYYNVVNTRAKQTPKDWKHRYAIGWRAVPQHITI